MAFGSEVGTGHVSIFPSMKGFRSAVDKEMRGAGKSGSNRFSQAFGNGSKSANRSAAASKGIRFECPGRRRRCAETVEA